MRFQALLEWLLLTEAAEVAVASEVGVVAEVPVVTACSAVPEVFCVQLPPAHCTPCTDVGLLAGCEIKISCNGAMASIPMAKNSSSGMPIFSHS